MEKRVPLHRNCRHGTLTEWLGNGLQNRLQQFESARYLSFHLFQPRRNAGLRCFCGERGNIYRKMSKAYWEVDNTYGKMSKGYWEVSNVSREMCQGYWKVVGICWKRVENALLLQKNIVACALYADCAEVSAQITGDNHSLVVKSGIAHEVERSPSLTPFP